MPFCDQECPQQLGIPHLSATPPSFRLSFYEGHFTCPSQFFFWFWSLASFKVIFFGNRKKDTLSTPFYSEILASSSHKFGSTMFPPRILVECPLWHATYFTQLLGPLKKKRCRACKKMFYNVMKPDELLIVRKRTMSSHLQKTSPASCPIPGDLFPIELGKMSLHASQ